MFEGFFCYWLFFSPNLIPLPSWKRLRTPDGVPWPCSAGLQKEVWFPRRGELFSNMHFSCWHDSKTSQLLLLWKLASPSFLLLRPWFKKSLNMRWCPLVFRTTLKHVLKVLSCVAMLFWVGVLKMNIYMKWSPFLRDGCGLCQSPSYWKERGREGVVWPELLSPEACPCADLLLPRAVGGVVEEELKKGFGVLMLICPLGNGQNLSMVSFPGWKDSVGERKENKESCPNLCLQSSAVSVLSVVGMWLSFNKEIMFYGGKQNEETWKPPDFLTVHLWLLPSRCMEAISLENPKCLQWSFPWRQNFCHCMLGMSTWLINIKQARVWIAKAVTAPRWVLMSMLFRHVQLFGGQSFTGHEITCSLLKGSDGQDGLLRDKLRCESEAMLVAPQLLPEG